MPGMQVMRLKESITTGCTNHCGEKDALNQPGRRGTTCCGWQARENVNGRQALSEGNQTMCKKRGKTSTGCNHGKQ